MNENLENNEESGGWSKMLLPEGLIMMMTAFIFDFLGIFISAIPVIGLAASSLVDITAFIVFGLWMLLRGKKPKGTKKTVQTLGKATRWIKKTKWLKPVCMFINIIPVVGSLIPLWSLVVYAEVQE
jgi:hypothetical protein